MALYQQDQQTGQVTPFHGDVPKEAITVMESMDDEQIIENMTSGVGTDVLFYRFPIRSGDGAKEVIGISVEGGYEIANNIRNLEVLNDYKIDRESDPDYIYVGLRVKNLATNNTLLGMGRACKFMIGRGNKPDRERIDEHAFVKGISKAQRNGILHHADQRMLAQLIETWAKGGKGKLLQAPPMVSTGEPRNIQPPKVQTSGTSVNPNAGTPRTVQPQSPTSAPRPEPAPVPSSTVSPNPAPVPAQSMQVSDEVKKAQDEMTQLRVKVHVKFQKELGISAEKRSEIIKQVFKDVDPIPDSLTQLSINQLNTLLQHAENMIAEKSGGTQTTVTPAATTPAAETTTQAQPQKTALGFDNVQEQEGMCGDLFDRLTNTKMLGLAREDAIKFISERGFAKSREIPKDKLQAMLDEVQKLIEAKSQSTDF